MSYEIKKLFRYSRTDPTTPPPHTHTHDPLQAEGSSCEGDNWAQNPTDEGVGSNYSPLLLQISINIYKYTYIYVHLVYTYSRYCLLFTCYHMFAGCGLKGQWHEICDPNYFAGPLMHRLKLFSQTFPFSQRYSFTKFNICVSA